MQNKPDRQRVKSLLIDWLKAAAALLDDVLYVVLFIVLLRIFNVEISLWLIILLCVLLLAIVFFMNKFIISSFHIRKVSGVEGMIGQIVRVVQPLNPVGTIFIDGEHWKAKTIDENAKTNDEVEVIGLDGLMLLVKHR